MSDCGETVESVVGQAFLPVGTMSNPGRRGAPALQFRRCAPIAKFRNLRFSSKPLVELGRSRVLGEKIEGTFFLNGLGGANKSAPCGEGQAGADGYAPDAEISELRDRELAIETGNENIDRFWRNRFHDLLNLVRFPGRREHRDNQRRPQRKR